MSKEVSFSGWVSIIPDAIIKVWIELGYIPNDNVLAFTVRDNEKTELHGEILYRMENPKSDFLDYKWVKDKERKEYENLGYEENRQVLVVKEEYYDLMLEQIRKWYDEIFIYVTTWLKDNNFISLKKGSFNGGFCATGTEDETTKDWGAPLANLENKVTQIKEKFGRIVVYTYGITKEERIKLEDFEKHVTEKFDCCADFS